MGNYGVAVVGFGNDIGVNEGRSQVPEGNGIYYYISGKTNCDRYEGHISKWNKEGKGIYYYSNGDRYEGDFKNDLKEGKGVFYYSNGDREMGDYKNGNKVGRHVTLHKNGKFTSKVY